VLEDHRAGPGDLSGHGKALDETQRHKKYRSKHAYLLVCRQHPDDHRRETHQKDADEEHGLATVGVAPVPEEEGADGASDVAGTVSCQ
jgi:hypothetical protein